MMRRKLIITFVILLGSIAGISAQSLQIEPQIKYELGGGAGHYDYAPSFIIDQYGIIYGYLCENREPFKIVDYIYLYKGIPATPGSDRHVWQPGVEVMGPSAIDVTQQEWDTHHVCDPDVREFKTTWKGETYNYIMTYLGVDQWFNHNQIGLAVSKSIEGPWKKWDGNPLVGYEGRDKWGTGQSTSIVTSDSTITLFYHATTPGGNYSAREIILNDLDNVRLGPEYKIPFLRGNSYPAVAGDRLYMVSEMRTDDYERIVPTWVGNMCRVAYITLDPSKSLIENCIAETDPWIEVGSVTQANCGFPRAHNPGFLTDTRGYIPDPSKLVVYFTPAVTGEDWLWSYDLWSATFDLPKPKSKSKNKK